MVKATCSYEAESFGKKCWHIKTLKQMIKEGRELREGETAPVIFLVSSTANLHLQSFTTPVTGTPVLIFTFAFSGYPNLNDVAWGRLQR